MKFPRHLEGQLVGTVDAGGDKLIVDLTAVESASLPIIELALSAIQSAASYRCAMPRHQFRLRPSPNATATKKPRPGCLPAVLSKPWRS